MVNFYSPINNHYFPSRRELKKFDLELINNLVFNHPYQKIIYWLFWDYDSLDDEEQKDMLNVYDYFKLLDRYYRYGISFTDSNLFPEKICSNEISFKAKLYVYDVFLNNYPFRYLMNNVCSLEELLTDDENNIRVRGADKDVKTIDLDEVYNGPITLSEVEKWKRKVVNQQTYIKAKLRLLDPNIYHSLITFVAFSKFEGRPYNKIDYDLSEEGISGVNRKLNNYKDKYKHRKMYEDKIYNKIKDFLK